jgi:hypothetical protein
MATTSLVTIVNAIAASLGHRAPTDERERTHKER